MSIIEQARAELAASGWAEDDRRVMIEIMEKFFAQWDSGGAVYAVAPVLQRLIAGKPITPLSGGDDEWVIHDYDDDCYAQNKRCGSVFKRRDGSAYDIDGSAPGRTPITFPYWPERATVQPPDFVAGP